VAPALLALALQHKLGGAGGDRLDELVREWKGERIAHAAAAFS
jgi:hypothetical protein